MKDALKSPYHFCSSRGSLHSCGSGHSHKVCLDFFPWWADGKRNISTPRYRPQSLEVAVKTQPCIFQQLHSHGCTVFRSVFPFNSQHFQRHQPGRRCNSYLLAYIISLWPQVPVSGKESVCYKESTETQSILWWSPRQQGQLTSSISCPENLRTEDLTCYRLWVTASDRLNNQAHISLYTSTRCKHDRQHRPVPREHNCKKGA